MKKPSLNPQVGDLVRLKPGTRHLHMVGLVTADEKSHWTIVPGTIEVANVVVLRKDVIKIIVKGVVPKRYRRYLR